MAEIVDVKKGQGGDGSTLAAVIEQTKEVVPYEVIEDEKIPGSRIRFKVKVGDEAFKAKLAQTFKEFSRQVSVPGFRPGKAPEMLVRRRYEAPAREETVKRLVPKLAGQFTAERNIEPLSQTYLLGFKSNPTDGTVVEMAMEVHPTIDLSAEKLQGIDVKAHKVTIGDADVDRILDQLREKQADFEPSEEGFRPKDALLLTCVVTDADGERIEYRCASDYYCSNVEGEMPDAVAKALIGKKAGETVALKVTEENEQGTGIEEVNYEVTIHEVKARVLPELNDEFAKDVNEKFESVEDLKKDLRERALTQEENRQRQEALAEIYAQLRSRFEFEVPRGLMSQEMRAKFNETERNLNQMGLSLNNLDGDMVSRYSKTVEQNARVTVKNALIARAIARHFQIDPTEEQINAELERMAAAYNRKALAIRAQLEARKEWGAFLNQLTAKVTDDKIVELASITWEDSTMEQLQEVMRRREAEQAAILRGEDEREAAGDRQLADIVEANEAEASGDDKA